MSYTTYSLWYISSFKALNITLELVKPVFLIELFYNDLHDVPVTCPKNRNAKAKYTLCVDNQCNYQYNYKGYPLLKNTQFRKIQF